MFSSLGHYWLKTSTYDTAINIYYTFPFIMFPILYFVNAPYGRFAGKLGIDCSVPGKWSWCFMELISPIMFGMSLLFTQPTWSLFQIILSSCWFIHYINRSIIYPLRATSMSPIHILAFLCSIVFNILNGYTNGMWIGRHSQSTHTLHFWLGLCLWIIGFSLNIYHDTLLFNLRKQTSEKERYLIPRGGLFEYVSCPNYFSEILEWIGYAIAAWPNTPAILFSVATPSNLVPRAWRTHAWYKDQFKEYPSNRKAVIPFFY
ncbi:3-oxo-5-alpha-steroid 4-dehydrogenase-domain-containing protein [Pilobolus umbonatus]|nr:3-oxo-5-alpha-steroid 4-dehydrogenase-domain-containing protein [Pilobolus umbonatus]